MSPELSSKEELPPSAPDAIPTPVQAFPVVGIGASAGGVTALEIFFRAAPVAGGMAFVVILHLSPDHESQLAALLQTVTAMPVLQVTEPVHLERDRVYVIPPARDLTMVDGLLILTQPTEARAQRAPIDHFLRSLAESAGPLAAAVILSGSGADGASGAKRVKERGGVVLVQDPDEAEYDSMPRSAIATGLADLVLPIAELPARLVAYWQHRVMPVSAQPQPRSSDSTAIHEILITLRARTGHDFSQYKRPTLLRRIERRMQVNGVTGLPAYLALLRASPDEGPALLQDLLISVTNFFRDPAAWATLEALVPRLFAGKEAGESVRAWVVGCATGEEAYTLAMLLQEHALTLSAQPLIQVFATDIDAQAIAVARQGVYPDTIALDVSPERLQRFFTNELGSYRVRKEIRDLVLFAPHNILRDPPFSRLELITCRNVLIYIERRMQEQILQLFHFTLQPDGLLLLGSSESTDAAPTLFTPLDKAQRLFQRRVARGAPTPRVPALPLVSIPYPLAPQSIVGRGVLPPSFENLAEQAFAQYGPAGVIVNQDADIVHVARGAGRFLQVGDGPPSVNLLKGLQPELRLDVRRALYQARQEGQPVQTPPIRIRLKQALRQVSVTVQPLAGPAWTQGFALVIFHDMPDSGEGTAGASGAIEPVVRQLEEELQRTREQLRTATEQHDVAVEEHRASTEELQAINEELRATTEELETSKEELQAINEELLTVNHELKHKVDELSHANSDLQNLMDSTAIGTIFVDRELRIKRYTPSAQALINLMPVDLNRPLGHLTHHLADDQLIPEATHVLATLTPLEREVAAQDGRWYLLRIQPYRTETDQIDGVVLTFVDITRRKAAEEALRASEERLRLLIESVKDYAIITFTLENRVSSWNVGAERIFGYQEAEIIGQDGATLFTLEDRAAGVPADELEKAREGGRAEDERWHQRKDGTRFYASGVMTPLRDGTLRGFVKVMRDLTERKHIEEALRQAHSELEQRVEERTQALVGANQALEAEATQRRQAEQARQEVLRQLVTAQEEVQGRIALELHDQFGQSTAALRLWAAQLSTHLNDSERQAEHIDRLKKIVLELDSDIQRLARELRPRVLDMMGLAPALQEHLEAWTQQTGIAAQLEVVGDKGPPLPPVIATVLYRVVQEALTNVLKHADATAVSVVLQWQPEMVQVTVEDNGQGILAEAGQAPGRLGLLGMRERVTLVGGKLEIESTPGQGTTVFVRVSLPPDAP